MKRTQFEGEPLPGKMKEPAYHALRAMMRKGRGMSFQEMADELGKSRQFWSWHIKELERLGYIDRQGRRLYETAVVNYSMANMLAVLKRDPEPYGHTANGRGGPNARALGKDGGTLYKKSLRVPEPRQHVLQPGRNNVKLGGSVATKGRFHGQALYALTMEEGTTCPPCDLASVCYGGNMPFARRWVAGPELEQALRRQVGTMTGRPLVRLHVLGDFYSADYARLWAEELQADVFGYTHHQPGSEVHGILAAAGWDRMAIRTSWKAGNDEHAVPERGAVTIPVGEPEAAERYDAIICPEQTGNARSCATCGLCWNTTRNIAFIAH